MKAATHVLVFIVMCVACTGERAEGTVPQGADAPATPARDRGTASTATVSVASWNLEWFGDPSNGPGDEARQLENARALIDSIGATAWGLVEIVDETQWQRLLRGLPDYDGVLASDRRIPGGARWYAPTEQKLALLVRKPARIVGASLVLTEEDATFAGRPPFEATIEIPAGSGSLQLTLIVVHLKARADEGSWKRRQRAAERLASHIARDHDGDALAVVGDWNDGLARSISVGHESPFRRFVQDTVRFRFLTAALAARGESSTTGGGVLIDHHLVSGAFIEAATPRETMVVRPPLRRFDATTSDHYPVLSRFDIRSPR